MNESELRTALGAIAQADPVDEASGWAAITAAIDADRRRRRRHRIALGGSGLAVAAAAAAALVVVALDDDPRPEALEVVPPATEPTTAATATTAPAETSTTTSVLVEGVAPAPVATTGPVPARPLLVQRRDDAGVSYLDVYDADTGELRGTPVVEANFSINDPTIGPDGTIYFDRETGDTSHVEALAWGSVEPFAPFGIGDETNSPAMSPDGSTFAYVEHGVTISPASIVLVDVASGQERGRLTWRADDPDFFHTAGSVRDLEWSLDGTRLLFISSYEGAEALVVDADAASLSDATLAVAADVLSVAWSGPDTILALGWCCYPEYDAGRAAYSGPVGVAENFGEVDYEHLDAGADGAWVSVSSRRHRAHRRPG